MRTRHEDDTPPSRLRTTELEERRLAPGARRAREQAAEPSPDELARLDATWRSPSGLRGWLLPVNQSVIGKRFIVTAFVFFLLGGVQALVMRTQLATPESGLIDPDLYSQLFTMHGLTMMFFFAVPILEGFAIWLVPMMIGTRDMAFPRMNAFGYYVYLIAGVVLYGAFFIGLAPDAGWFNYPPLSEDEFSPGLRIDFWATMITFIEVSALVAAVELIATILLQRAPGMSLNRMPVFVWSILVMSVMVVFAMPAVIVGSVMLALDRTVDMRFFDVAYGGDPLLWQHLFWFFGHPEVYIIFLPALGFVSQIVVTFSRRRLFGYLLIVLSQIAIGTISFGLWVHHMFTTGIPHLASSFFTVASIMIAIPSGIQIFCWIATLWEGRPRLETPLLFVIAFIILIVIGGATGVMVASVPFDTQVHDSFFIVAHFHYVLIGGMVFPLFGAIYYWWPKATGRLLSETLGRWNVGVMFVGFNLAFFPMHQLGMMGMPRRVYTYAVELGWGGLNLLSTVGAWMFASGILLFLANALLSRRGGRLAGDNPWNADTLEWATSSPAPPYNFARIPTVRGRYALWDLDDGRLEVARGLRDDRREVLLTTAIEADPHALAVLPGPSLWPFLLAVAVAVPFLGVMWNTWWVPIGMVLTFAGLAFWHWPRSEERTPPWKEDG